MAYNLKCSNLSCRAPLSGDTCTNCGTFNSWGPEYGYRSPFSGRITPHPQQGGFGQPSMLPAPFLGPSPVNMSFSGGQSFMPPVAPSANALSLYRPQQSQFTGFQAGASPFQWANQQLQYQAASNLEVEALTAQNAALTAQMALMELQMQVEARTAKLEQWQKSQLRQEPQPPVQSGPQHGGRSGGLNQKRKQANLLLEDRTLSSGNQRKRLRQSKRNAGRRRPKLRPRSDTNMFVVRRK